MALSLENEEQGFSLSRELSPPITAVTSGQSHTPGPWRLFLTTDGRRMIGIGEPTGEGIVDCGFGTWRSGEEQLANARLIAAAPELLAELKWCFMGAGNLQRMAAAIAKAEGVAIASERSEESSPRQVEGEGSRDTPEPSSPPEDERSNLSGGWGPPYSFERYVDGQQMAEGVQINLATTVEDAVRAAVRLCPKRPNTVLVLLPALPQDHAPVRGREGSDDLQTASSTQCADAQARPTRGES